MANCPRCDQRLRGDVTSCPHCGYVLSAYGHPGIPLHRATESTFLCQTCAYELDNSCTFPQRPEAKSCTLYRDYRRPVRSPARRSRQRPVVSSSSQTLMWLLGIACIIGLAILLAR